MIAAIPKEQYRDERGAKYECTCMKRHDGAHWVMARLFLC